MDLKRWVFIAWLSLAPISGNAVTSMVAATYGNSMFLHSDGSAWGVGFNFDGALSPGKLSKADLSAPEFANASIIVGYGTDPDEMVRNGRYRTIYNVPTQ